MKQQRPNCRKARLNRVLSVCSLLLVSGIVCTILSACKPIPESGKITDTQAQTDEQDLYIPVPLSDTDRAEIERYYKENYGHDIPWSESEGPAPNQSVRYLTTVRNYPVLLFTWSGDRSDLEIGGHYFLHSAHFVIFVFFQGELIDLEDFYPNGICGSREIEEIHKAFLLHNDETYHIRHTVDGDFEGGALFVNMKLGKKFGENELAALQNSGIGCRIDKVYNYEKLNRQTVFLILEDKSKSTVLEAIEVMALQENVLVANPNYHIYAATVSSPDDP